MLTPFHNNKGELKFPIKAIRDFVYIWPTPVPTTHGIGLLDIPQIYQEQYQDATGVLMSAGEGYISKKTKKFIRTDPMLVPGIKVVFDNRVPWFFNVIGQDGQPHKVFYCTTGDVKGIVDD